MMKRLLKLTSVFIAVIAAAMCMTVSVCAYAHGSAGINDMAGLFTESEKAQLEKRQAEVASHTGWNIAVVTTNVGFGTDGYKAIEYAESYYDELFGYSSSGILYLIDLDYRHFCISGTADYKYFNDARVKKMVNACEERYFAYDDIGNLNTFYDYVEKYYDKGPFTALESVRFSFPLAIFAGLIAAGIGIAVVMSKYKFHYQPTANNYLNSGSINFYRRSDIFIREYTTRTRVDSGGSGGGSHHGSSGGHHHGGGGHGGRR